MAWQGQSWGLQVVPNLLEITGLTIVYNQDDFLSGTDVAEDELAKLAPDDANG